MNGTCLLSDRVGQREFFVTRRDNIKSVRAGLGERITETECRHLTKNLAREASVKPFALSAASVASVVNVHPVGRRHKNVDVVDQMDGGF